MNSPRLPQSDIDNTIAIFKHIFPKKSELWLFGSRVDPQKKGGDIDLFIYSPTLSAKEALAKKIDFLTTLKLQIGDQKIDVIIQYDHTILPIYTEAKQKGIQLL